MPKSFSMQILTNLSCNLACDYCYEKKRNQVNSTASAKRFINHMFSMNQDKELCELEFIGGESFLCVGLMNELTDYARLFGKKLMVLVSTNGTLLGNADVRSYIEKNKDALNIGVSLDGAKEVHNAHRRHKNGKGSYDDIVPHLDFLFQTLGRNRVGAKATFTKETFSNHYYQSILHLIGLGFRDISANIIYEEQVDPAFGLAVARVMMQVADYLLFSGLYRTIRLRQLNPDLDFIRGYNSKLFKPKDGDRNFCGSCQEMTCIGFDDLVYGCNRFCTMGKEGMNIGRMENGKLVLTNPDLKQSVIEQYKHRPPECRECLLKMECPGCAAIPYEQGYEEYLAGKPMCGWAYGVSLARFYMCVQLAKMERGQNGNVQQAIN